MKVRWSPTAISDLKAIRVYIANDNPAAARKIAIRIQEAANRLVNFPPIRQSWSCTRNPRVGRTWNLIHSGVPHSK